MRRIAPWLVAIVALVVYGNSVANGFALDDEAIIPQNPIVHSLSGLSRVATTPYWPNTEPSRALYRPVTIATYIVDWQLWHGRPWGFHFVNAALHAATSALVVVLLLQLAAPVVAAAAGGLLFAVHPVHVEAVSGVVGRAEVLVTLFVLAACIVHLRRGWRAAARWILVAVCYFAALMTKESAVALPLLLIIVDALDPERGEPLQARVRRDAPLYAVLATTLGVYLAARHAVLGAFGGTMLAPGFDSATASTRVATAVRTWPEYVRLLVFPRDLIADYSPNVIVLSSWHDPIVWLGLALGAAIVASAVMLRRRAPWWTAAVAWFAASIFIVSNLVIPVGIVLAERNLYLPSVAVAFAAVPLVALFERRRRLGIALGAVVLALCVARTWTRTPVWRSTPTVLANLAATHPESYRAQSYLGDVAMHAGRAGDAVPHYARAYGMVPLPIIGESYANALAHTSDWRETERIAAQSCSVEFPSVCLYLIDALVAQNRPRDARSVIDSIAPHVLPSLALATRALTVSTILGDSANMRLAHATIDKLTAERARSR